MEAIIILIIQVRDCWDWIALICAPLSIIISFITFLIGLNIKNKANKLILEKQFNKVYELYEKLQNTKIPIDIYSENKLRVHKENELVYLTFSQLSTPEFFKDKYKKYNIIISREIYDKDLSFINYKNDMLLPKSIADVIGKLYIQLDKENKIDIENKEKYKEVVNNDNLLIGYTKKVIYSQMINENPEIFTYSNTNIRNLDDFVNTLHEIYNEINKWINKSSNLAISLNLK